MRSRVSMVIRLPSRRRATSLPSLTARRPKVDSAISERRQKSEIRARIWSFFIGADWDGGGQREAAASSYHHLPTWQMTGHCSVQGLNRGSAARTAASDRFLGTDLLRRFV